MLVQQLDFQARNIAVFTAGSTNGMQMLRKEQLYLAVHYKNKQHDILGPKLLNLVSWKLAA